MEYIITKKINGEVQYLQQLSGEDAYTDDLGFALIFKSGEINKISIQKGEEYTPIYRDEDNCLTLDPQEAAS